MTNKNWKWTFVLSVLIFIWGRLATPIASAQGRDTLAHVEIVYTTTYPGKFAQVEVRLKNEVEIAGFQFEVTFDTGSNFELINFHTDSIGVETFLDTIWEDTCTGPEPHGDSCFVVDTVVEHEVVVRYCNIDTVGSLISDFSTVECRGFVGDTTSPECKWVTVFGMAEQGNPIPPSANYRTLFKLGVDVACISDTLYDRTVYFYIVPGVLSYLSDPDGELVPFQYHQGTLTAWFSVPGDANADSTVNLGDVVYMIEYLYKEGPPPCIPETGDPNHTCVPELGDIVTLIDYLYRGGAPPSYGCWHGD